WVSSLEVENILTQVEGVAEAAVIGLPDDKWGERPHALVVAKPDYADKLTVAGIKAFFEPMIQRGEISKWFVPDKIAFVAEIPKTSVGKIDKKRIREMQDVLANAASA
ncbi:MAG TPA: long-chain fatty acid--CoA ligase, partial [Microscillaceae bacterium]|nr:long-chain fatty acid--CoA ligase [Microscillaceae bacterium]